MSPEYIKAKNLLGPDNDTGELFRLIEQLEQRFQPWTVDIETNRAHFHKLKSANPVINKPYEDCTKFQSDVPRQTHKDALARMTENKTIVKVESAQGTKSLTDAANNLAIVLNAGWEIAQDRIQGNIEGALSSAQIIDKLGIIQWGRCDDIWPELPKREHLDTLPRDDEDEESKGSPKKGSKYERNPAYRMDAKEWDEKDSDEDEIKEEKKRASATNKPYREKYANYEERILRDQAQAGFPYFFRAINPAMFRGVEDLSSDNGLGMVLTKRLVGKLDYVNALRKERKSDEYQPISINEADPKVPVYAELTAPEAYLPSFGSWGEMVVIYELWTRDEVYEVCAGETGLGMHLVKSAKHLWKMPPFAIAPAVNTESSDWITRYQPMLQGVYDLKPAFDRIMTLFMLIAEMIATPVWYYAETKTGRPRTLPDGQVQKLTRDSALATFAPPGYELRRLEYTMDPAFMELIAFLKEEMGMAKPQTGQAEVSTSTDPWAIRLQQAQASVEPAMLMRNRDGALQIAMRSVAGDMSLKPEDGGLRMPPAVFTRTKDGKVNYDEVVSVKPEEIKSLDIKVETSNVSSAEQVTLVQLGMQQLGPPDADGNFTQGTITLEEFFSDFAHKENPSEAVAILRANRLFAKYLQPAIERQELAKWAGTEIVLGPDGDLVGMGAQTVDPAAALKMAGQQPSPNPPNPAEQQGNGMLSSAASMGALPDLASPAPDVLPVQGRT